MVSLVISTYTVSNFNTTSHVPILQVFLCDFYCACMLSFFVRESKNPRSIVESHDAASWTSFVVAPSTGPSEHGSKGATIAPQLWVYFVKVSSFRNIFLVSSILLKSVWKQFDLKKHSKGQLNSELIYEVIVFFKGPTKNLKDFCPTLW